MTNYNHTMVADYAPVNAIIFNSPLSQLDAAIGDLSLLSSTEKGSLVGAINELVSSKSIPYFTNRHLNLDGTDVTVQTSDCYLQIDSCSAQTVLKLPAISSFGVGRELKIMFTSALVASPDYILLYVADGSGDTVIGGYQTFPLIEGIIIFRTMASYPGAAGACWVRTKGRSYTP